MKHVLTKSVPKLPKVKQKETSSPVARDLLQCADQDTNFMKTIITSDGSWVCGYNLETKVQTSRLKTLGLWGQRDTPSLEVGVSDVDSFLQSWRHHSPWVHTRWSHTISKSTSSKFSAGCMMQCGASDLFCGREVTGSCTMTMLLPAHPTLFRTSWLNVRSHKSCSPLFTDMVLCDSFLFPKMKILLKNRFQDMEEIKQWLFQRVCSKSASDNGRTTETNVFCLKGIRILFVWPNTH